MTGHSTKAHQEGYTSGEKAGRQTILLMLHDIARRWQAEVGRHDHLADVLAETGDDEERLLHIEIARVLRNCAHEILEVK